MSNQAILKAIKLASDYLDKSLLTYAVGVLKALEIALEENVTNEGWDIDLDFNEPPQYAPESEADNA